jgi:ABC-type phosphate transport system auxiliary subunit
VVLSFALQIVGILYSVFDMRGHVDMEDVSKQFEVSKNEMYYDDSKETRIDELLRAKKLSDAMAAKLLSENSVLQQRIRQLEDENATLKKGKQDNITTGSRNTTTSTSTLPPISPRK